MSHRGNLRGRGGGRGGREPIKNRLGQIAVYPQQMAKKYRYERATVASSSLATIPGEARIRHLVRRFLKSYYEIFDEPGRANLASQYSPQAFFSFSATFSIPTCGRNLLTVRDPETRIRLLLTNRTNIANALSTFSPTEHLVDRLSHNVPYFIVSPMSVFCMQIIVTGVFKDTSEETNPLKAFTRVFILKQANVDKDGEPVYEIFNDLFMLQPPTPDQIKRYHQDLQIHKRLSGLAQDRPNSSSGDNLVRKQGELLKTIMARTRMNEAGSRQLLQDCQWDEKKSIETFDKLFSQNLIPQNLFTP